MNFNGYMKCELYVSAVLFLFSPQNLAYYLILHDNHCYGRLSLWTLAAEKRSCTDDFTLFRVSAFGEYYGIANKLVLFNCSGMYAFPVPTVLFIAHQKNYMIFFFPFECKQHEEKLFSRHQRDWSQNDQFRWQATEIWILACFIPLTVMRPAIKAEEKGQRGLAHSLYW